MISRRAHSGAAGDLAGKIATVQLEAARAEFGTYVEIENGYHSNPAFRGLVDRDQPQVAREIRNGRLAAVLLERLSAWKAEAGEP